MSNGVRVTDMYPCCIDAALATEGAYTEGDTMRCPNCESWLVYRNEAWEFDHERTYEEAEENRCPSCTRVGVE